jgi:hypothetical protein
MTLPSMQAQAVSRARENLAVAIANAVEACLKKECCIYLDDRQRDKLYLFVERELLL